MILWIDNKIPAIENLATTKDAFDVIDLSNNEIKKLDNFPKLYKLTSLLISNNRIASISEEFPNSLPNLTYLILNGNNISELSQLKPLSKCLQLRSLSLLDNPICRLPFYRLEVLRLLPQITLLDFRKVKNKVSLFQLELFMQKIFCH